MQKSVQLSQCIYVEPEKKQDVLPGTGDDSLIAIVAVLAVGILAVVAGVVLRLRKK